MKYQVVGAQGEQGQHDQWPYKRCIWQMTNDRYIFVVLDDIVEHINTEKKQQYTEKPNPVSHELRLIVMVRRYSLRK